MNVAHTLYMSVIISCSTSTSDIPTLSTLVFQRLYCGLFTDYKIYMADISRYHIITEEVTRMLHPYMTENVKVEEMSKYGTVPEFITLSNPHDRHTASHL